MTSTGHRCYTDMNFNVNSNNEPPLIIACAGDDKFSLPMAIMLYSVMVNSRGSNVEVYILNAGISVNNQNKITKLLAPFFGGEGKLHWIKPNYQKLLDLPVKDALPLAAWYRLLIPEVLPPEIGKVIYLDCDLLVEKDITRLQKYSVDDYYLLAVTDRKKTMSKSALAKSESFNDVGNQPYFNSGFMVMNLDLIRKEKIVDKAIYFGYKNSDLISCADQDALNAVSIGKWSELDPSYNIFVKKTKDNCPFLYESECILHFIGSKKPWMPDRTVFRWSNDIGFAHRRYHEYMRRSGWFSDIEWFCYLCKCHYYQHIGNRVKNFYLAVKKFNQDYRKILN